MLVIGWGSTYGAITAAYENMMAKGYKFSRIHLKYLNPFQKNLGEILNRFKRVLVCEMNLGQLSKLIRMEYLKDVECLNKVQGLPFKAIEIENKIIEILNTK